ncbi:MAG: DUF1573 domain-containing protein [Saprospiraceae bacterium]|nr:DUF1573 domain-containing protein [Saprospiraceae bacterium]
MKQLLFILLVFVAFGLNAQKTKTKNAVKSAQEAPKQEVVQPVTPSAPQVAPEFIMAPASKAKMTFESLDVNYGTIEHNADPVRIVKFTNTGTEPLIINNATSSCGCTVPKWPTEPIAPGQSASLEVRYATDRVGRISKSITVRTNAGDHTLQVIGEVLPKKKKFRFLLLNLISSKAINIST